MKHFSSMIIGLAFLSACAVYDPVHRPAQEIDPEKPLFLVKDELQFRLANPSIRNDTLMAEIDHDLEGVGKRNKTILILKPDQELVQYSPGVTTIPFTSIQYLEMYENNKLKSRRAAIGCVITSVVVGAAVVVIAVSVSTSNSLKEMDFIINEN